MNYDDIIPRVLSAEGGYVNHKSDRGGATNYGITQNTYLGWLTSKKIAYRDVSLLTIGEAKLIYMDNYWLPSKCDQLPPNIRDLHFDAAVNHGVVGAARILQDALKINADGVIGPVTIRAAQVANPDALRARYIAIRYRFYGDIINRDRSQLVFIAGWLNRMATFL